MQTIIKSFTWLQTELPADHGLVKYDCSFQTLKVHYTPVPAEALALSQSLNCVCGKEDTSTTHHVMCVL